MGDDTHDHGDLHALLEALPFDVWVRDETELCTYANATARRHWPGLVGSRPADAARSTEVEQIWRQNNARAAAGETVRGEVTYDLGDHKGTFLNIITPIRRADAIVGTAGINIDVTELRERERDVARLEALLRSLFESAPLAIGIRSVHGDDLVHVADNPACATLLGRSVEALRDVSDRSLGIEQAQITRAIARFRQSRAAGVPLPFEMTFPASNGARTLAGRVTPLPATEDERYAFFAEDVTEVRTLEGSVMRAERLATLGTMAASIAHEINNPLTLTLTHLALALRELEATPEARGRANAVDEIRSALVGVERVASLVKDLLTMSKPEHGYEASNVDVALTVRSVLGLAGAELRQRARVDVDIDPQLTVRGNSVRLGQVLLNLLINAAQAFDERGGNIVVTARRGAPGEAITIVVADDGPGIAESVRARLFEPFATGKRTGTGLGLYVSRQIVEQMGGRIEARDRPGGGTEMRVTLPSA